MENMPHFTNSAAGSGLPEISNSAHWEDGPESSLTTGAPRSTTNTISPPETVHAQRFHEDLFLFRGIQSQEANRLPCTLVYGGEDVQSFNLSELFAQPLQGGFQGGNIRAMPKLF